MAFTYCLPFLSHHHLIYSNPCSLIKDEDGIYPQQAMHSAHQRFPPAPRCPTGHKMSLIHLQPMLFEQIPHKPKRILLSQLEPPPVMEVTDECIVQGCIVPAIVRPDGEWSGHCYQVSLVIYSIRACSLFFLLFSVTANDAAVMLQNDHCHSLS